MRVDKIEAVCLIDVVAPNGFGEGGFVNQAVGVGDEIVQEVEFLAIEFQFAAVDEDGVVVGVNGQVGDVDADVPVVWLRRMTDLTRAWSSARWKGFAR